MGTLPKEETPGQHVAELIGDLQRGDLQIVGAFDFKRATRPPVDAGLREHAAFERLREQLTSAIRPNRAHLVMVFEVRPSREALERMIQELRQALDVCADPEEGWPETEVANTYEDSRDLVPEDLPADDPGPDEAREAIAKATQASFYPRSRYGSRL